VDTAHAVLGEQAHREDAYVALTRGRERNTAYLSTIRAPDAHDQERLTGTPVGRLAAILDRAQASRSAELQRRVGQRDGASLAWIGGIWDQVTAEYARDRYTDVLTALLPAQTMDRLVAEPGYPRLIRAAELAGHHPEPVLTAAVGARPTGLDSAGSVAGSVADVLRWRVRLQTRDRAPELRVDPADWTTWEAREAAERARQLETIHTQRAAWSDATQTVLEQARLAAEELTRRGLPVRPPTPSAEPLVTVEDLDSPGAGQHAGTHGEGELVPTVGRGQAGAALPITAPEHQQAPDGHAPAGSSVSPGGRPRPWQTRRGPGRRIGSRRASWPGNKAHPPCRAPPAGTGAGTGPDPPRRLRRRS
jgi:hypothetical protein